MAFKAFHLASDAWLFLLKIPILSVGDRDPPLGDRDPPVEDRNSPVRDPQFPSGGSRSPSRRSQFPIGGSQSPSRRSQSPSGGSQSPSRTSRPPSRVTGPSIRECVRASRGRRPPPSVSRVWPNRL